MITTPSSPFSTQRRTIVLALAAVPLLPCLRAHAVPAAPTAPAAALDLNRFLHLSQVLTGRPTLDPIIGGRALAALSAEDRRFSAQAGALLQAMTAASFTDMRTFKAFIAGHEALRPVALKIISAWYLGYTGTPAGNSDQDDARFVSYAGALMYQPTIDATVVPTYSRGATDYWAAPPATLATD